MDIYQDKDTARKDEIAALGGQGVGQNVFTAFYDRFKEVGVFVPVDTIAAQYECFLVFLHC